MVGIFCHMWSRNYLPLWNTWVRPHFLLYVLVGFVWFILSNHMASRLLVPCCNERYDFSVKTMFGLSFTPICFVGSNTTGFTGIANSSIWGRTKSDLRGWCYLKSRDRKWRQSRDRKWPWPKAPPTGNMLCACATGSCGISAIIGPFHRKWRQSRHRKRPRKRPCPEVIACACASASCGTVSRVFSYSSSSTVVAHFSPEVGYRYRRYFPA